jgi:hypothetical protein
VYRLWKKVFVSNFVKISYAWVGCGKNENVMQDNERCGRHLDQAAHESKSVALPLHQSAYLDVTGQTCRNPCWEG